MVHSFLNKLNESYLKLTKYNLTYLGKKIEVIMKITSKLEITKLKVIIYYCYVLL